MIITQCYRCHKHFLTCAVGRKYAVLRIKNKQGDIDPLNLESLDLCVDCRQELTEFLENCTTAKEAKA